MEEAMRVEANLDVEVPVRVEAKVEDRNPEVVQVDAEAELSDPLPVEVPMVGVILEIQVIHEPEACFPWWSMKQRRCGSRYGGRRESRCSTQSV